MSEDKDYEQLRIDIMYLAEEIEHQKDKVKEESDKLDVLKQQARDFMKMLDMTAINNTEIELKISIPITIDPGLLRMYHEDIKPEQFITETTKTKVKVDAKAKANLLRLFPKAYEDCKSEGTPRVLVKRLTE